MSMEILTHFPFFSFSGSMFFSLRVIRVVFWVTDPSLRLTAASMVTEERGAKIENFPELYREAYK